MKVSQARECSDSWRLFKKSGNQSWRETPDTEVGQYTDVPFTIENLGTTDLVLSGSPRVQIGGTDASQFSVIVQPSSPVAPRGTTTFTIRFAPASTEIKSATVSILNNDADENP